ncbi:carboxypeptidase [Draconibacterium sp. IB214405]|uniref:S10 family peptidase n=1 Tax=Draconibacterium sp. IB214405 TaxID=3097352 RepID=UPI002A167349|nr:carboxypeptidase [Draconibacterium sp. IB214405]MDX8338305.1 carboxypeptidase [Draconibacterium sp. IB214405]
MNKSVLAFLFLIFAFTTVNSQSRKISADSVVVTQHEVTINGNKVSYTATTGTQPVWDENGKPIASLFFTYYKKDGAKNADRPLLISFNGGPGSASVWMHLAYTGPRILNIDDEGYPVQPYGFRENPFSVLDVTDIVYVNPANTGYSRTIPESGKEVDKSKFFGINADITYLADWLNTFVSRYERWESPKFIIGESYGGTRVSGLAYELQERQWMYLNGVIMVSPADYNIYNSDAAISNLDLPYYAATAWHHNMLPNELQQKDLLEVLPEVEDYTLNILMPALARGGSVPIEEKEQIAEKMSFYSGLSKESILAHNLRVPTDFYWKELLRKDGFTVGRLDSRYLGLDGMDAGDSPDFNAEIKSWLHSFTPAINHYLRTELGYKTDLKYYMFGPVHPWNNENNRTRENLRTALAENPYLNILYQVGYYDGACNYFATKYSMWQMDPSGKLSDRIDFKGYRSGHMMYLRSEDLKTANDDIRQFILKSLPGDKPAIYNR